MSFYYKNKIRSHHYVYLTVCTHDASKHIFYIGKRSSYVPPEQDKLYLGSGSIIKRSIKKYGRESFRKIILETCNTEQEAYDLEQLLADEEWMNRPDTMNLKLGGSGGTLQCEDVRSKMGITKRNTIAVRDADGNIFRVDNDDPRWLSGELVGVAKGKNRYKKSSSTKKKMSDHMKGKITAFDKDGNGFHTTKDDPRWSSGEIVSSCKGKVNVIDVDGNIFRVDVNDPRYLSGELKAHTHFTGKDNPGYENLGKKVIHNENETLHVLPEEVEEYLNKGWLLGFRNAEQSAQLASLKLKGNFFITDGVTTKRLKTEDEVMHYLSIPDGKWRRGMTKRKKKASI